MKSRYILFRIFFQILFMALFLPFSSTASAADSAMTSSELSYPTQNNFHLSVLPSLEHAEFFSSALPSLEQTKIQPSAFSSPEQTERSSESSVWNLDLSLAAEEMLDSSSLQEIEALFDETTLASHGSFLNLFKDLITGSIPFDLETIRTTAFSLFLSEISAQKEMALQILLLVITSAVFFNLVRVFEKSQIAEISFYMMYILIAAMLIRSFSGMDRLVLETLQKLIHFTRLLLPSYLTAIVFSSGSLTAIGFYQVTLVLISLLQAVVIQVILPLLEFYLTILIVNQTSKEDLFSRFAQFIQTVIDWALKSILGMTIGLQTVQTLVAPGVDSLKNSAAHRIAKAIPGLGTVVDAASETVTGSALVIRNAMGTAGMIVILSLCLIPILKLAACTLIFRFLCAVIQPICEKRMLGCIESISSASALLLKILCTSMAVFLISLAMICASLKGG